MECDPAMRKINKVKPSATFIRSLSYPFPFSHPCNKPHTHTTTTTTTQQHNTITTLVRDHIFMIRTIKSIEMLLWYILSSVSKDWIHQSRVLVFRVKSVFSSYQSDFLKFRSNFVQDNLNLRRFLKMVKKTPEPRIGVLIITPLQTYSTTGFNRAF